MENLETLQEMTSFSLILLQSLETLPACRTPFLMNHLPSIARLLVDYSKYASDIINNPF